ncbi:MAG: PD-(D/E)XK nuclease family transposase [Candidatus Magnetoovum sp. WYHC-5]|nr:PD-(D/E)XK nuclease family transposase [Candidatus Magnetoovum sp. WYHC-5]
MLTKGSAKKLTSKAYVGQLEKGTDYTKLNQVIFIGVMDFELCEGSDYITKHLILNTSTYKQELPDLEFDFIELPKFQKTEQQLQTIEDKWIFFIKNAENLTLMPKSADFIELKEAYDMADKMIWSKEELDIYDYWLMKEQDERGAIEYSFFEGEKEGEKKGLIKGKEEGLIEGLTKGKEEGLIEGLTKGKEEGLIEGLTKGKEEGLIEGQQKGLIKGLIEGIEALLELKYGIEGIALIEKVRLLDTIEELEILKNLIKTFTKIEKIEEYLYSK